MSILQKALSSREAEVLFAIWKLEHQLRPEARGATRAEIATMLDMPPAYLSQLLYRIGRSYVETGYFITQKEKHSRGRSPATYILNNENIVTLPETALILLQLMKFQDSSDYLINSKDFVEYFSQTHQLDKEFIQQQINILIDKGYLQRVSGDLIRPLSRVLRENEFLRLLASEYKTRERISEMKKT